jgi:hypothetical protein
LSHDSGNIEILKNNKGSFEHLDYTKLGNYNYFGNWMGIASGDYDNDGDQDLFLTNIGNDIPGSQMSLGDIKNDQNLIFKHVLLRNDGKFKFVEESKKKGIPGDGFGWGALFADIDNDSNLDLLFSENVKIYLSQLLNLKPSHYYNNINKNIDSNISKRKFDFNNHNYGQTPIITDINNDNIKDIIWINYMGPPIVAYLNKNKQNNYIIVNLPKNHEFINSKIVLDTGSKKLYYENIIGGLGLGSDSNDGLINFGLNNINMVRNIKIYTLSGKIYTINNPKINSIIKLIIKSNNK